MKPDYDVIIVGGGLAGLVSSIVLAKAGKRVLLLEKKQYPYHKVCGEYVSNEVLPYLQSLGFDPFDYGAAKITKLRISSPSGRSIHSMLDLGAFALSRYRMDDELAQLALRSGATVRTGTRVTDIQFEENGFRVTAGAHELFTAKMVIGSWGKRETLDKKLQRAFIEERTSYMAVKYHIRTDYPVDEIGLDNFRDGYSGISKIEDDRYNVCSFYRRPKDKKKHSSIQAFREEVMFQNPVLKSIFTHADFVYDEPVVINEICFAPKPPVENHMLMCGDSAGLITPLCGNGMSMAIAGARIATNLLLNSQLLDKQEIRMEERLQLEAAYREAWDHQFRQRLFWGRTIQWLFGNPVLTDLSLRLVHSIPPLERALIKVTHGHVLEP